MNTRPGDIVIAGIARLGFERVKRRPVLVLAALPGRFQDRLLCGISTYRSEGIPNWDEVLDPSEPWFPSTNLRRRSVVKLSFLDSAADELLGEPIGAVPLRVVLRLQARLSGWLMLERPA